jgi:hypothetical protein
MIERERGGGVYVCERENISILVAHFYLTAGKTISI